MSYVVGYTYRAENYCPEHIQEQLPTGPYEEFDGWSLLMPATVEEDLSEIALAFGFDREDETTFDSGDFPKRIWDEQVDPETYCGECGRFLGRDDPYWVGR